METIFFVRHGECPRDYVAFNKGLNVLGREQITKTAEEIKKQIQDSGLEKTILFYGPKKRVEESAEIIRDILEPLSPDVQLREELTLRSNDYENIGEAHGFFYPNVLNNENYDCAILVSHDTTLYNMFSRLGCIEKGEYTKVDFKTDSDGGKRLEKITRGKRKNRPDQLDYTVKCLCNSPETNYEPELVRFIDSRIEEGVSELNIGLWEKCSPYLGVDGNHKFCDEETVRNASRLIEKYGSEHGVTLKFWSCNKPEELSAKHAEELSKQDLYDHSNRHREISGMRLYAYVKDRLA